MLSVHVDPASTAIGDTVAYGAPPRRVVPSEHDRTQLKSVGRKPAVQATSDKIFACGSASERSSRACLAAATGRPASRVGRAGRLIMRSSAHGLIAAGVMCGCDSV